ncbi:uncharacterized protein LOC134285054 [Aedes albopictus]|uniref:Uncharacterized protein n=1 Tax=Aedes albopictus TaxID=7160 RepID=A0ABM1Y9W6_AEDAL
MMINHQHKEVGMATRLDALKQQLEEFEVRRALWRKQCQDEERRRALEFERELAQMDKKFSDAMEKIELEYAAKKEALMCRYSGKSVRNESTTTKSDSLNDQAQLQFACSNAPDPTTTTSQINFVAPRTQPPQPLSAVSNENNGIPHTVPIVSTTIHSNQNQSARSMQLASDPIEMEVKQSTVNMREECALVKKAPVVVVSVERNAVSECIVFDPGGAAL